METMYKSTVQIITAEKSLPSMQIVRENAPNWMHLVTKWWQLH